MPAPLRIYVHLFWVMEQVSQIKFSQNMLSDYKTKHKTQPT